MTGEVLVRQVGLLMSPGADGSSGSGTAVVAAVVLSCLDAVDNVSSTWQRRMPEEMHQGNSFTESATLVIENTFQRQCLLPGPFLPISTHVSSPSLSWQSSHLCASLEPAHPVHFLAEP